MSAGILVKYVTTYAGLTPKVNLSDHTLIFTHIPKTAGTTLDHILSGIASARMQLHRRARGSIYATAVDASEPVALRDFESWPDRALANCRYVTGHLPFGQHRRLSRPYFYVTVMRDPAARLLSKFRFGVERGFWAEATPLELLFQQGQLVDNLQTRQIAGIADRETPCSAEIFNRALSNLRTEYAVVGVSERFDEMLKVLITLLGWPDVVYADRQVAAGTPSTAVRERCEEAARRFYPLDFELYAEAVTLAAQNVTRLFQDKEVDSARQNQVLVSIPGVGVQGQNSFLLPMQAFDEQLSPKLKVSGAEVHFL